jgi:hypothetical protein
LKLDISKRGEPKGQSESGPLDPGGHVSTGQKIQRKAKVEVLKHPKPKESKSQESSIYKWTLVNRSRAPGKVVVEFQLRTETTEPRRPKVIQSHQI